MELIPWKSGREIGFPSAFSDLEAIQQEMNRLFNTSFARWLTPASFGLLEGGWSPAVDLYESKDTLMVKADIPGMTKDEIEILIQGNILTLKGEKKEEREVNKQGYVRSERFYGSFHRTLSLPAEVNAQAVKAVYHNGVLELTLPKKEEAKPKEIPIEVK